MNWLFGSGGHSIGASASNEYSGLISFQTDWFDLLVVQGTLKSFPAPQFKGINSWHPTFFIPTETLQARREWQDIVKVMKGKSLQSRLL